MDVSALTADRNTINTSTLNAERAKLQRQLETERPPVSAQPFYQHIIMYFWPLMYFCLGVLVFILRPHSKRLLSKHDAVQIVLTTIIVFIFAAGPLTVRNLIARESAEGRTVYAYSNLDIDSASFVCQLTNFLIFSGLLSILWNQWIWHSSKFLSKGDVRAPDAMKAILDIETLARCPQNLGDFRRR
jgi:hypothetical protein